MSPGDLIVLGQTDRVVGKYIVQQITPSADLTAELTLVRYVPEVYKAETGAIPPWNPDIDTDGEIGTTDLYISKLTGKTSITYVNRKPFGVAQLDWTVGGYGYYRSEVYMTVPGKERKYLGETQGFSYEYMVDMLAQNQVLDVPVVFEVIPFTAGGVAGRSAKITLTLTSDSGNPSEIEGFTVNVQSETINVSWNRTTDPDLDYYELRYTPDIRNPDWDYSQFLATAPHNATTIATGARTGSYMMRSYDTSGNKSGVVTRRTTVVDLPNVELIADIDDRVNMWPGYLYKFALRDVERNPMISEWVKLSLVPRMDEMAGGVGDLVSTGPDYEVEPYSVYTFHDIVDFTEIYEARIYSKLEAHGEYSSGETAPTELWDAYVEYRITGDMAFISDWDLMSNQADMIGTSSSEWGPWRRLTVNDITAKLIQIRIVGKSYDSNVRVVVTYGLVQIDAMDRVDSKFDVLIAQGLNRINFDPPYMFDNVAVAISIDGDDTPLVSRVTNKNRLGCDIELRHAITDTPESGKVDIVVRGQGKQRFPKEDEQRYLY
jgi:hypothetical protein